MARPSKPKPAPIEPHAALRRLAGRYGPTAAYDVVQDAVSDVQVGKRSGRRDGDDALVLDALAVLPLVRDQLDSIERELLQVGHEDLGLTMAQLAPALGVKTRQAAEQRYQRKVHGASGANLADARQRRRARTAFDAWLADHRVEVEQATAGMVAATRPAAAVAAGIDPLGFAAKATEARLGGGWEMVLSYAQAIACTVISRPGDFGAEVVAVAETVIRLHAEAGDRTRLAAGSTTKNTNGDDQR
jgi:hypothetical protein